MSSPIIWLASYPRSGVTLLRRLLHAVTGWPTYSVYPDRQLPEEQRDAMGHVHVGRDWFLPDKVPNHDPGHPFLVKTHEWPIAGDHRKAVLVVRDGRDVCCSYARYLDRKENFSQVWAPGRMLDIVINGQVPRGPWGMFVERWLDYEHLVGLVRYQTLLEAIRDGRIGKTLGQLLRGCGAAVDDFPEPELPKFSRLHESDPDFFHRGGSYWREVMTDRQHDLFWLTHGSVMERLGCQR